MNNKNHLQPVSRKPSTLKKIQDIKSLKEDGFTNKEISNKLSLKVPYVNMVLNKDLGLGKKHEMDEKVHRIGKLMENGLSAVAISREVGLTPQTVSYHIRTRFFFFHEKERLIRKSKLRISEESTICNKCLVPKNNSDFFVGRPRSKSPYKYGYCKDCRYKQLNSNIDSNYCKYLSERYRKLRERALASNIDFSISLDEYIEIFDYQNGKCWYTGATLNTKSGNGYSRVNMCTVDKVNPALGYVTGNILFCSQRANTIKNDQSLEEFDKWMPSWCVLAKSHKYINSIG